MQVVADVCGALKQSDAGEIKAVAQLTDDDLRVIMYYVVDMALDKQATVAVVSSAALPQATNSTQYSINK